MCDHQSNKKRGKGKPKADADWGELEYLQIRDHAKMGMRLGAIAVHLHIGLTAMNRIMKENERAREAFEHGQELMRSDIDQTLFMKAKAGSVAHMKLAYHLLLGENPEPDKQHKEKGGLTIQVVHAVGNDTLSIQKNSDLIEGVEYEIDSDKNDHFH